MKEVQSARKWAQDSLLANIAEAWVGLRIVCVTISIFHGFISYPKEFVIMATA